MLLFLCWGVVSSLIPTSCLKKDLVGSMSVAAMVAVTVSSILYCTYNACFASFKGGIIAFTALIAGGCLHGDWNGKG